MGVRARAFGHGHDVVVLQNFAIHLVKILMQAGAFGVAIDHFGTLVFVAKVGPIFVFGNEGDHVHTEAVDALLKPVVHHVVNFSAQLGVFPIEIRLLTGKVMQVVSVGLRVVAPGIGLFVEVAPAAWRGAFFSGPPVVVIAIGVVARTT